MSLDYAARPDRTVIVAPNRAERQDLTQLIRADLQVQGQLSSESRTVPVLVEQDFNPRYAPNYKAGDEIHYKTGTPSIEGIQHNSVVTVQDVNPRTTLSTSKPWTARTSSTTPISSGS